jgi:hypothetical protein
VNPRSPDVEDYQFLSTSGAKVEVRLNRLEAGRPVLFIGGNRAGLLSLANILLWLVGNVWRREFLSLAELPFVTTVPPFAVTLRITLGDGTGRGGILMFLSRCEQIEWAVAEDDLRRIAVELHRVVSAPSREYFAPLLEDGSVADVEFRMLDAAEWIERGHS